MLCNPLSNYPDSIDTLIFFQDINLENISIMEQYNNLIAQGKYDEANDYINNQEYIYGYFADYLNMIENRIYSLQKHILTITPKQPFVSSDNEPAAVDEETIWI